LTETDRFSPLRRRLEQLTKEGLRRTLSPLEMTGPTTGREPTGRCLHIFSSNDYLGLAHHPEVMAAWSQGQGCGSARLIAGDRPAHHALESALEDIFGRPATLFSSGWHANLALLSTLLEPGDSVASDALNHASIIDGIRLSRANKQILPHGTFDCDEGTRLLVQEGIYSMDGDILDLKGAREHTEEAGTWWMVDEAHSVGVLGPRGRGASAEAGQTPDFIVGTLGKAFGSFGAFVIGPPELRELLISRGRSFIFTTGLPEPAARAALVALELASDERRALLADRTRRLRSGLASLGIRSLGQHHIVPIVLGGRTMEVSRRLRERGFLVPGIRPPTVPEGSERLRVTLSAAHTDDQVDGLIEALKQVIRTQA
jgi:8-amino-7-oxononanoate synthase